MTVFGTRPSLRSDWACFAGICLLAIALRIPVAGIPLERAEGEYAYIAQRWMQGDIPYRDLFSERLPWTFCTYALIERFLGTTASAIHWGTQLYTLGTLAVVFLLGRRLASPLGGVAAAAFAASMTSDPSVLGNAAYAEVFMLLPLTAAMLALSYAMESDVLWWAFATGALGASAVLFKQAALASLIFCMLAVAALARRRAASAAVLFLGAACVTLPVLAYFVWHDAWRALYDGTVTHNLQYQQRLSQASFGQAFWAQAQAPLRSFWPILLLAAVQTVSRVFSEPAIGQEAPWRTGRRNTLFCLAWLIASFVGTASAGYFRPQDFLQLVPPLAVLAGMGVTWLSRGSRRHAIAVGLVAVPIVVGILSNLWYYSPGDANAKSLRLYASAAFIAAPGVGTFIAARSQADEPVFVLGSDAEILHHTERPSATRYIVFDPLTGPFADARQRQLETLREVQRSNPRFVVTVFLSSSFAAGPDTPADIFDGTMDLINRSYRLAAVVGVHPIDTTTPLVSGAQADAAWLASPVWYGGPSWCALAVWERVTPAGGTNRAAAEAESRTGMDLDAKGDTTGAIAHYREALRLDPNFGAAHNNLAAALAKSGQLDEAIAQYTDAIRFAPLRAEPHWNLAAVLQDSGRLPEAIDQLRAAVRLNPKVEMRYRLATAYAQAGYLAEAEAELEQVLREHPDSNGAEARLAWLLATANDPRLRNGARAVQLAEDAAQRTQRRDANVLNSLAAAYAEVGRYTDAVAVAEQAIEVAPGSGQAGLRDALAERLARYRTGQPVRDGPGAQAP